MNDHPALPTLRLNQARAKAVRNPVREVQSYAGAVMSEHKPAETVRACPMCDGNPNLCECKPAQPITKALWDCEQSFHREGPDGYCEHCGTGSITVGGAKLYPPGPEDIDCPTCGATSGHSPGGIFGDKCPYAEPNPPSDAAVREWFIDVNEWLDERERCRSGMAFSQGWLDEMEMSASGMTPVIEKRAYDTLAKGQAAARAEMQEAQGYIEDQDKKIERLARELAHERDVNAMQAEEMCTQRERADHLRAQNAELKEKMYGKFRPAYDTIALEKENDVLRAEIETLRKDFEHIHAAYQDLGKLMAGDKE